MDPKRRTGVFGRLIRRLTGGGEAEAEAPVVEHPSTDERIVDDEFRLAIDTLCQDREGMYQTRLQVISLVEFREAVGERWPRFADKVMLIAEGVIHAHIGKGNLFARQGQDFFLLVFRSCSQDEGRYRALTIAQELGVRLLGDQFEGLDRPLALAAEITLADAIADGRIDLAAIDSAVGQTRREQQDAESEQGLRRSLMPSHFTPDLEEGPRRAFMPTPGEDLAEPDRHGVIGELPAGRKKREPGPDPGWQPMAVEHRERTTPAWQKMEGGRKAPTDAPDQPTLPPPPPLRPANAGPLAPTTRLSVAWRPTWMAKGESIAAYGARIRRRDETDLLEGGRAYGADAETAIALDRAVLEAVAAELAGGAAGRGILILPLHWATVTSPRRMSVTAIVTALPEASRNDRLIVELFGVPADIGARSLTDAVRAARGLGREAWLRTSLGQPMAALAADCGCTAIGVDLDDIAADFGMTDAALLAHLGQFRDEAGRARLDGYVWGCRRRALVAGAVRAGLAFVNGPALMKDMERPGPRLPAPKSRLAAPPAGAK